MTWSLPIVMAGAVVLFLAIGCKSNTQTTGHYIDDTAITTSVKTHLATAGPLKTMTQISVKTIENTVYLSGVVPTPQDRSRATPPSLGTIMPRRSLR